MRKTWWLIGTPIVVGGLGLAGWLATDLIADDVPLELVAEKDAPRKGGVFNFRRGDKTEADEAPAETAPSKYTRNKTTGGKTVNGRPAKNYYDELFDEPQPAARTTARTAAARTTEPEEAPLPRTSGQPRTTAARSAAPAAASAHPPVRGTEQARTAESRTTARRPAVTDEAAPEAAPVRHVSAEKPATARTTSRQHQTPETREPMVDDQVVQAKHETSTGDEQNDIELVEGRRAKPRMAREIPEEPADPSADRVAEEPVPTRVPVKTARAVPAAPAPTAALTTPAPAATVPAATVPTAPAPSSRSLAAKPKAEAPTAHAPAASAAVPTAPAPTKTATLRSQRLPAARPLPAAEPAHAPAPATVAEQAKPAAVAAPASEPAPQAKVELTSAAAPVPAPRSETPVTTAVAEGDHTVSGTPAVSLRWEAKGEVNVGQECKCLLIARNTSKVAARDVVVEAFFPRSVRLINAEPFPSNTEEHLTWNFENIAAGEEKSIEIVLIPAKRGEMNTSATVRFTGTAATILKVEEPQLKVAVKGTQSVEIGESATQTIVVTNPGSGVARDVAVVATIPDGLETASKGKQVELAIGALAAGETREIKLSLTAVGGGDQLLLVEARGGGNLVSETETAIQVTAPKLDVAATGPSIRYVGRAAQYHITATNKGAAATNNVRVVHTVPDSFEFVKADKGGVYNPSTRTISWFVGRIEAGQSQQLTCELTAKGIGDHAHKIEAAGENGALASTSVPTKVDGAASLVVEIRDLEDPVEVKAQTTYEVTVRNDGSKPASAVALTCELPAGMELVSADGPTTAVVERGLLIFKPISSISQGDSQTFRVKVTSAVAGNLRFRTRVSSASVTEPLVSEELTKFYAD